MDLYLTIGGVIVVLCALYAYTHMAIKYGIKSRDAQVMGQKLTDWKNLNYVTAKKLEKYDRTYQTLSHKINRAHSTADINNLMHEIWEGDAATDSPTQGDVQQTAKNHVVPNQRKGGK